MSLFARTRKVGAFSLGELLIAIAVIGVLVIILMPILRNVKPDENEAMHKKSTYVVERIINELSSDDYLYPNNGEYSSLSNTDSVTYNGETHGGTTKFCTLFASRINKKPGTEVNCTAGAVSVTSVEGVDWYLPISNFRGGAETLMVDVNGGEGPNELGVDRFEYQIQPGFKVPKIEVTHYETVTERPTEKEAVGDISKPEFEEKAGLKKYNISCGAVTNARILGVGSDKVNGNYTLVAIPNPGYKCNWFTRQVTVKDADVTASDCALSCSPDNIIPVTDEVPPGGGGGGGDDDDDDDDDDDCKPGDPGYPDCQEKSGLISVVVQWSGEVGKCSSACDKANCLYKENEAYSVTLGGSQDETEGKTYEASWRLGSDGKGVAMGEGPMIEYAECTIKEENEECYDIKPIVGDPNHCPYQLPKANCPNEGEETKYLANQEYGITVTPEEGYKFNNSAEKSTYKVKITNSDATPDFASLCKGDAEDTIEIDTTGVSTTGHTISGKGTDSIKVGNRAAGDAIIVGIKVKPSSNAKKWKVVKEPNEPGGMWSFDPASGKGDSDLSVTLGKDMGNDPVCLVAKYEDSSAESNKVCFTFENPTIPGPTIEIKVGSLSATYGGYNPTETTPSVSYSNGTVTVKTAQDVTISGLSVVPSNSSKPWKIKKTGSEESVVTPSSGSGTKAFTVELAKNHFTGGCVYAEYNDGSASSNQVCFNIEGNPEGDYCVINLVGTGDTGGGIYADVSLGGFLSKTAKLNSSNSYKATWSGLRCGKNYTINVTKAANSENTAQTITATASPSSFSNLSGVDNEVKVNFKKEGEGEANKKFTISCSKGQTSKEVKITTVCENFSNLGTSAVYTLKDSSTGVLYMTSALSSDACNTTFSEVPVMPDGVNSINVSATGLPSDVTVSGGSCQIGGGETQNGQIEITSAVDSAGCSTSSYFDIIKAIIHAKGADSKDYTVEHIGNPGVSYSMTVPAGFRGVDHRKRGLV